MGTGFVAMPRCMMGVGECLYLPCTCLLEFTLSLVNECSRVFFKHPKFSNYFIKKSTITISNAFNTQLFIKNLPFKVLKECPNGDTRRDGNWTQALWVPTKIPIMDRVKPRFHGFGHGSE